MRSALVEARYGIVFPGMACYALPPSGNAMPAVFLLRAGDDDFAGAFADHAGARRDDVLFTDSGTSALYAAFRALAGTRPGGRVAVPAWCCPSVPQAAIQAGLMPVPVDLDPETLAYEPFALERERERGLAAAVLVHFFGMPAPLPSGNWDGVLLLRDCAQDFDFEPESGDPCPRIYSFGRGKALNAGHGGALCLPPAGPAAGAYAKACRRAHAELPPSGAHPVPKALAINILSHPRLYWAICALPGLGIGATVWASPLAFARMSEAFPRLGSACLEAYLQRRHGYRDLLSRYRALFLACDPERVRMPLPPGMRTPGTVAARFPLLFGDGGLRERFHDAVKSRYGGVTRMYPAILPELPGAPAEWAREALESDAYPGARRVAREILTLPVAAALLGHEAGFISCLESILREAGALRIAAAGSADWAPVPEGAARPALFPGGFPYTSTL